MLLGPSPFLGLRDPIARILTQDSLFYRMNSISICLCADASESTSSIGRVQ